MSKHELIVNNFLKRSEDSCNSEEFEDIFSFKLRGGGDKRHKVGIKSNNTILDCVLSFFRDMVPLWHEINSHELCNHKLEPGCFYCLLRSLSLRSMNPQVRTSISPVEVLSYLEMENIDKLQIQDMVKSIMDFLSTSEEKISTMFKSISIHCQKCGKDVSLQNHEILNLHVDDDKSALQEILNSHLQCQIDDHFSTCHGVSSNHMNLRNAIKISKDQSFLILALDKQIEVDLESDLLVAGKFYSCISAVKANKNNTGEISHSTVFKETNRWSKFDTNHIILIK